VAALAGLPNELALVVRPDLPIRSASDFKGRSIGITGPSLTGWLVQALSHQQGFGPNGIKMNYAQRASSWALMKIKAIDESESLAALSRSLVELDYLPRSWT
jgi:ABC-type nitrate/sulfonate/bicarbonate transport system substrate-binding protein